MDWTKLSDLDLSEAINCVEFLLNMEIPPSSKLSEVEGALLQEEDMRLEDMVAMDKDLKGQPINPPTSEEMDDMARNICKGCGTPTRAGHWCPACYGEFHETREELRGEE